MGYYVTQFVAAAFTKAGIPFRGKLGLCREKWDNEWGVLGRTNFQ